MKKKKQIAKEKAKLRVVKMKTYYAEKLLEFESKLCEEVTPRPNFLGLVLESRKLKKKRKATFILGESVGFKDLKKKKKK